MSRENWTSRQRPMGEARAEAGRVVNRSQAIHAIGVSPASTNRLMEEYVSEKT